MCKELLLRWGREEEIGSEMHFSEVIDAFF